MVYVPYLKWFGFFHVRYPRTLICIMPIKALPLATGSGHEN